MGTKNGWIFCRKFMFFFKPYSEYLLWTHIHLIRNARPPWRSKKERTQKMCPFLVWYANFRTAIQGGGKSARLRGKSFRQGARLANILFLGENFLPLGKDFWHYYFFHVFCFSRYLFYVTFFTLLFSRVLFEFFLKNCILMPRHAAAACYVARQV